MRDALASLAVFILAAAVFLPCAWLIGQAPEHSNQGWLSVPMLALSLNVPAALVSVSLVGAWVLIRKELRLAPTLLATLTVGTLILSWKAIDAANVVFDGSPPVHHEVEFVRFQSPQGKSSESHIFLRPVSPGAPTVVSLSLSSTYFQPGRRLRVTTHAGALGRPYALDLRPVTP